MKTLRCVAGAFLFLPMYAAATDAGAPIYSSFADMINEPVADYRLSLRITSSSPTLYNVSDINVEKRTRAGARSYRLEVRSEAGSHDYCFKCAGRGRFSRCGPSEPPVPERGETSIPGTLLPWVELTGALCQTWILKKRPAESSDTLRVEVRPLEGPPLGHRVLADLDKETGEPLRMIRIDQDGRPLRVIEILETGSLSSLKGIRRAIIRNEGARVLIEARSLLLHPRDRQEEFDWHGFHREDPSPALDARHAEALTRLSSNADWPGSCWRSSGSTTPSWVGILPRVMC